MFGFLRKKDDLIVLNQKLGRFLNTFQYTSLDVERQRTESRTRLGVPCLMFLFSEVDHPHCYALGVTTDVSLHGLALVTNDTLTEGEYMLVFGPPENRMFIHASCRRFLRADFGTNSAAFEFIRAHKEGDYPAIAMAVRGFEAAPAAAPSTSQTSPRDRIASPVG